jgi:hypothetical protein
MTHMQAFQAIADANPVDGDGSRNSGEPGYKASVDYVARLMTEAGYNVTIQAYKFFYFAFSGTPLFSKISPTPYNYAIANEWNPGQSLGDHDGRSAAGVRCIGRMCTVRGAALIASPVCGPAPAITSVAIPRGRA